MQFSFLPLVISYLWIFSSGHAKSSENIQTMAWEAGEVVEMSLCSNPRPPPPPPPRSGEEKGAPCSQKAPAWPLLTIFSMQVMKAHPTIFPQKHP